MTIATSSHVSVPEGDDPRFPRCLRVLEHVASFRGGAPWVERLPELVASLERDWDITAGMPFHGGSVAWVAPCVGADGAAHVLKVSWPHAEQRHEVVALGLWNGRGAVHVERYDERRSALLLEHTLPGTPMRLAGMCIEEALEASAAVCRQLWIRTPIEPLPGYRLDTLAHRLASLPAVMDERLERLRPRFDPGLVALGRELLCSLPSGTGDDRLLHGDLHPGNLVSGQREPWLAIDPKPAVGDPASDPQALILQLGAPIEAAVDPVAEIRRRYSRFARASGLDVSRLVAWSLARTVEWVALNLDEGRPQVAAREMQRSAWFASVLAG